MAYIWKNLLQFLYHFDTFIVEHFVWIKLVISLPNLGRIKSMEKQHFRFHINHSYPCDSNVCGGHYVTKSHYPVHHHANQLEKHDQGKEYHKEQPQWLHILILFIYHHNVHI